MPEMKKNVSELWINQINSIFAHLKKRFFPESEAERPTRRRTVAVVSERCRRCGRSRDRKELTY